MHIKKLKYTDKSEAIEDLIAKGILLEDMSYGQGVHAVVEVGLIVDTIIDDVPTYYDGYHYDLMIEDSDIVFENEVFVANPKHSFAGW